MSIIISKHDLNKIILEEMSYILNNDSRYFNINNSILQERILYEGILDSITSFVGNKVTDVKSAIQNAASNVQNFSITLKKIIEKPQLIKDFINILNHRVIKGYLNKVTKLIAKLNIPSVPAAISVFNFFNSKIQQIKNELNQYISNPNWKSVFIVMSFAAILKYVNDWITEKLSIVNIIQGALIDSAKDFFTDYFQKLGNSIAQTVLSKIKDIKTYLGWIGSIVGGINFFLELVGPSTRAIAQASGNIIIEGTFDKEKSSGLHGWFQRQGGKGKSKGWVDCNTCRTDAKTGKKTCKTCGRQDGEKRDKYPACRPTPSACNKTGTSKKKSSTRVSWKKKKEE